MPSVTVPELSVVVPSHDRPLRLRWLLNALAEQTLDRSLWEVVVCHDSRGPETDELLKTHPLARDGTLRFTRNPAGTAPPGANRNAALQIARAPTIVFTDDDCRPPAGWLEAVRTAVAENPGAIIQGLVKPDPAEWVMQRSPYPRELEWADVPRPWAECANIVYPRALLDAVGGFLEDMYVGEDTDLFLRIKAITDVDYVGSREALTFHSVEEGMLIDALRATRKWQHLPLLLKRHPEMYQQFPMWIFWKRRHFGLPLMYLGVWKSFRNPLWLALAIPWMLQLDLRHGGPRGRVRNLTELPGVIAIDTAEMLALIRGSIRYRTVFI